MEGRPNLLTTGIVAMLGGKVITCNENRILTQRMFTSSHYTSTETSIRAAQKGRKEIDTLDNNRDL
jgi:hypothetical protein